MSSFNTLILDIADVLFSWSPQTKTSIPPEIVMKMVSSPTWFEYEMGRHTEKSCYDRIAAQFSFEPSEVYHAFEHVRDSLQCNEDLAAFVYELKQQSNGSLKVFAMSNISIPDYAVLRTKPARWDIFDHVFTSGAVGERKPSLKFYRHVLAESGVDPYRTVFIDDKRDNVISARSLGLHGIIFENTEAIKRALRNLFGDPLLRGHQFLENNARNLISVTDSGIELEENFAQLLILEATKDRSLVVLDSEVNVPPVWNFFRGKGVFTTEAFPLDLDTVSLGLMVIRPDAETANSVMNRMLEYINEDGITQTYFDYERPRFDPVVCANTLSAFYSYGRGHELNKTLDWVYGVLLNRAYLDGTRYYLSSECFLYSVMRLLQQSDDPNLHKLLGPLLKRRVQEHIGNPGDALVLAMRIIVCHYVGIRNDKDLQSLFPLQCEDGGWEIGWIYRYGSSGIKIGNRGLTTALAMKAIKDCKFQYRPTSPPLHHIFLPPPSAAPQVLGGI